MQSGVLEYNFGLPPAPFDCMRFIIVFPGYVAVCVAMPAIAPASAFVPPRAAKLRFPPFTSPLLSKNPPGHTRPENHPRDHVGECVQTSGDATPQRTHADRGWQMRPVR